MPETTENRTTPLGELAERYMHVALQLQNHDPNPFVYFGPKSWQKDAKAKVINLAEISGELVALRSGLSDVTTDSEQHGELRRTILLDRIDSMITRAEILTGTMPKSFDDEVQKLYRVTVPERSEAHFKSLAAKVEDFLPGKGALSTRIQEFRDQFIIAPEKVETVMTVALREAQARARANMDLPEGEDINVCIDKSAWYVGFNEYLGNGQSNIRFNISAPIHLERVVELATHEAYPGHHVQATLLDQALVKGRGWFECSMLPLYGAHTILAEGGANYAVNLSFNAAERLDYDRNVVLPLVGLEALDSQLEMFHQFVPLVEQLNYARNVAARKYLYSGESREQVIKWLMEFGLETRAMAEQRMIFIDSLRSYVVTYNYGLDWITDQIERGENTPRLTKWRRLREMFEHPTMPMSTDALRAGE